MQAWSKIYKCTNLQDILKRIFHEMFLLRQIQLIQCFLFVRWWFWGFLAEEFLCLFLWNDFLFLQSLHFSSLETHMWQFLITKNTPSDSWLGSCSSFRNLPFNFFPEPVFLNIYGARNGFQGMISASLCSLAGRYNNPIYSSSVPSPHRLFKNSSSASNWNSIQIHSPWLRG